MEQRANGRKNHQENFQEKRCEQNAAQRQPEIPVENRVDILDNGLHSGGVLFNKPRVVSKYFTSQRRPAGVTFLKVAFALFALANVASARANSNPAHDRFLGMNSCSSSSCHGGAGENKNQCVIWSKRDFHSRAFATLTTARSERLAEVLKIKSAVSDATCTSCHAPFQTVPEFEQAEKLDITVGVSCESCHGPAENWLRSHTRPDFTHADRVNTGMRDLKNLYVRANTCVACHQNVSSNLLAAGHPELIFELDGQAVSEPKHWRESTNWNGAQTWLVGQAVALREISWQLSKTLDDKKLRDKWNALLWLLEKVPSAKESQSIDPAATQFWSDELARKTSAANWSPNSTRDILNLLAKTADDFRSKKVSQAVHARRAERLVLALDRLILASAPKLKSATDAELNELFSLVQSLPDFDPQKFAATLEKFSAKIADNSSE
jgi:hypothetical protein